MKINFNDRLLYSLTVEEYIQLHKTIFEGQINPNQTDLKEIKELLTIEEAAEFLNLSKATLYTMNSRRRIPFVKVSGKIYYRRSTLIEWLASGERKTTAQLRQEIREGR